jgi:cell shape-determining protein MreD
MMRRTLMLLTIALGAVLQQLLPAWPLCGGIKPPVVAAIALHFALRSNRKEMWWAVLFAAVLQDGLDLGTFGPALLSFPAAGLLAYRIRNEIFADGIVSQVVLGALLGFSTAFIALLVYTASGQRDVLPLQALVRLISSAGLGMVTLPLASRTITWIETSLPKRKGYGWQ